MDLKELEYCKRCDRIVSPKEKTNCSKCRGKDSSPTRGRSVLIVVFIAFIIAIIYYGSAAPNARSEHIDAVARELPRSNKLAVTSKMLMSIENPEGSGAFVFVPEFNVAGTDFTRKVIWFVLNGEIYCLNGATKGSVTPNLPFPREDPDADWASTGHDMYGITSYGLKLAFEDGR